MSETEANILGIHNRQTFAEVLRVKRSRDVIAHKLRLNNFRSLSVITLAGFKNKLTIGEGQANTGLALSNQGNTLDCLEQSVALDDCLDGGRFREETTNRRVVTIHQGRCRAASTGLETDQRRSTRLRFLRQTDLNLCTRSHGLCDVLKNACLDQCGLGHIGNRIPLELTHGQTVAVSCQKRDVIAVDFNADGCKKRKGFIARSCD